MFVQYLEIHRDSCRQAEIGTAIRFNGHCTEYRSCTFFASKAYVNLILVKTLGDAGKVQFGYYSLVFDSIFMLVMSWPL